MAGKAGSGGIGRRLLVLGLVPLALLAGCGGGEEPTPVEELGFVEVGSYPFSGISSPRQVVVQDSASWAALWLEHTTNTSPAPPRPQIDFGQQVVAAVFLGQSVACHRPQVDSVARTSDGAVRVAWRIVGPGPTELCPAVVLTPVQMVRFANPQHLPVRFEQLPTPASR